MAPPWNILRFINRSRLSLSHMPCQELLTLPHQFVTFPSNICSYLHGYSQRQIYIPECLLVSLNLLRTLPPPTPTWARSVFKLSPGDLHKAQIWASRKPNASLLTTDWYVSFTWNSVFIDWHPPNFNLCPLSINSVPHTAFPSYLVLPLYSVSSLLVCGQFLHRVQFRAGCVLASSWLWPSWRLGPRSISFSVLAQPTCWTRRRDKPFLLVASGLCLPYLSLSLAHIWLWNYLEN